MSVRLIIYLSLVVVTSLVGIIRYKQLSFPYKLLAWSVIMTFLTVLVNVFWERKYHTNAPVLQIQCIKEYFFYSVIFYFLFKNQIIKKFIIISIIIFVVFFPINAIFLQPFFNTFPTNINTPAQALYAVFSLLLFKEMLDYPVKINIIKQSIFWFNTAMLFYATTAFFLLGLTNYISKLPHDDYVYLLWWAVDDIFVIFLCAALLINSKEKYTIASYS